MTNVQSRTTFRIAMIAFIAGLAGLSLAWPAPSQAGGPVTIPVQNRNDDGVGSLRDAIEFANNFVGTTAVIIAFDLPPPLCTGYIVLQSPLPDLVADRSIRLDGYTQPGSSVNTLEIGNNAEICVRLSGAGSVTHALRVPAGSPAQLVVYGLDFVNFDVAAIDLQGGRDHLITGSRFGFLDSGAAAPNLYGVRVGAGVEDTFSGLSARIGSELPQYCNTIDGSGLAAILLEGSHSVLIENNYIGANPDGDEAIPNFTGVVAMGGATDTVIQDNVISGNVSQGILLLDEATSGISIRRNRIGYQASSGPLGNGGSGIRIAGAHDNQIGGAGQPDFYKNYIGFNGGAGVFVQSGQRNWISENSIGRNDGIGIDLGPIGVNPNDNDSIPHPPDYANRGLNYPVLTSAIGDSFGGIVSGSLTSIPGADYRIEFFADVDGGADSEARILIGGIDLTISQTNPPLPVRRASFSAPVSGLIFTGFVTATATDEDGNTSEISMSVPYRPELIFADGFE